MKLYVTFAYQAESVPTLKGAGGGVKGMGYGNQQGAWISTQLPNRLLSTSSEEFRWRGLGACIESLLLQLRDCARFSCSVCEGRSSFKGAGGRPPAAEESGYKLFTSNFGVQAS